MNDSSTVRSTITTAVEALDGWRRSRWAPGLFGRDVDHVLHHTFVVGLPDAATNLGEPRQRVAEGLLVDTTIEVEWAHRLRGDSQDDDYDAMLDAEQDLVGALRGIASLRLIVTRMVRQSRIEGWIVGTVLARAVHRYALT